LDAGDVSDMNALREERLRVEDIRYNKKNFGRASKIKDILLNQSSLSTESLKILTGLAPKDIAAMNPSQLSELLSKKGIYLENRSKLSSAAPSLKKLVIEQKARGKKAKSYESSIAKKLNEAKEYKYTLKERQGFKEQLKAETLNYQKLQNTGFAKLGYTVPENQAERDASAAKIDQLKASLAEKAAPRKRFGPIDEGGIEGRLVASPEEQDLRNRKAQELKDLKKASKEASKNTRSVLEENFIAYEDLKEQRENKKAQCKYHVYSKVS
jgi:hypothetical protein